MDLHDSHESSSTARLFATIMSPCWLINTSRRTAIEDNQDILYKQSSFSPSPMSILLFANNFFSLIPSLCFRCPFCCSFLLPIILPEQVLYPYETKSTTALEKGWAYWQKFSCLSDSAHNNFEPLFPLVNEQ